MWVCFNIAPLVFPAERKNSRRVERTILFNGQYFGIVCERGSVLRISCNDTEYTVRGFSTFSFSSRKLTGFLPLPFILHWSFSCLPLYGLQYLRSPLRKLHRNSERLDLGGGGNSNFPNWNFSLRSSLFWYSRTRNTQILLHREPNYRWPIPQASDDGTIWYPRLVGFGSMPFMYYSVHKIRLGIVHLFSSWDEMAGIILLVCVR